MAKTTIELQIINKEEKWWAKLTFENFTGKSIWLDEQYLFGESLKSNLFSIKDDQGNEAKYIGFSVKSSTKKYVELKDKETKTIEGNLSKAYKLEKNKDYTFQYVQPVLFLQNPEQNPNEIAETLDTGGVQLNTKEVAATLKINQINGKLLAELEIKNNSKRDIWVDLEAIGGSKVLKQNVFQIINSEGEKARFKNVELKRAVTENEERFVRIEPEQFYWSRSNLSSKYSIPLNEAVSIQYSGNAYAYLKPVEGDENTLQPMVSNIVNFTQNAVIAELNITQEEDSIYANLTFTNKAKTNVWLNTKYLGSEDLEYDVFTFQEDNGLPTSVDFNPKITSHEYEYEVDHFIELAPGDHLQTQVNLTRNYILEEQAKYLIKYEALALMWKQPKKLKDYDEYSDEDEREDQPYFDLIKSERVKMKIDDAKDPMQLAFETYILKEKAYAKLTITSTSSKPIQLNTRKIGGDMLGEEIFNIQNDFGIQAEWIEPKHDDDNEETITLEKGDSFTTETCLNEFYEIKKGELYNVKIFKDALGIDLKQWDEDKNTKQFTIPADADTPEGPLTIEFKHDYGMIFDILFMNKTKKPLWINGAAVSPEGTKNIFIKDAKGTEINRKQKPELYIDWLEIDANDSYSNCFDISEFWKVKAGSTYSLHYKGLTYTTKDPYQLEDDSKVKLTEVIADSKLFETEFE